MLFGVGSSTQGVLHTLREHGVNVSTYLLRDKATDSPALEGRTYSAKQYPNPCVFLRQLDLDFILPMSIDWSLMDWTDEFLALDITILSPTEAGMLLERDRDFARELCQSHHIPFPKAFVAQNRIEAGKLLERHPGAYVIKNPLCSPQSPIHTVLSETEEDTRSWLSRLNYEEGIFLQEYMGQREAGHIAFVSGGEIHSLVTNQEYKRAFDGNMGVIAGAPLGGIIEQDPADKYNLARDLLLPLLPWFKHFNFHGPVQVTAIWRDARWYVLEYNVRIGVTCGPVIMQMLQNPVQVLSDVAHDRSTQVQFNEDRKFGCSLTLAGYGYPFSQVESPEFPIRTEGKVDCDIWWNEVKIDEKGQIRASGQRLADVVAIESTLQSAIDKAYRNIKKIRCTNSYYRTDIGKSLWPPASVSTGHDSGA